MTVWISRRPEAQVSAEIAAAVGPLAGLRVAVEDNVDVAGLPTSAGCPEFSRRPDRDAAAVAALRAAGAVVVGKTNLDQFATGPVGTRSPDGPVPDSRRPEYVSGGSSSGSAVAVATGTADIAIGTDTAGSGRVTAALRGIVGIKPTIGVISTDGVVPASESLDCVTVFGRDLHLANRAMAALAAGAPDRPWPADTRLAASPHPVVAIPDRLSGLDPAWSAAFDAAAAELTRHGVTLHRVAPEPFLRAGELLRSGALVAEHFAAIVDLVAGHPDATLDPSVREVVARAGAVPARRLAGDRRRLRQWRRAALAALDGTDALLMPTVPMHTRFANLLDMCAVGMPAGTAGDARFGVTVLARAFDDAVALDIAALLGPAPISDAVWPAAAADAVELVVFGAHLRGGPLVHQLTDRGARFAGEITTAARYRMTALSTTPAKPAVTRVPDDAPGAALTGHRWLLSPAALGAFLADLPAPMQLGKVEFADGSWRTAFGCDAASAAAGIDISGYGGWAAALARVPGLGSVPTAPDM
ncbi:allophanate hydrolase [Mycolicibacterium palauense]|uniref:allophanate hydrolase n=1 Tax=Mycolicibacterium palauense TaxID=2034511 RepID=UPI000BFF0FA9|nr:allophanate hydrolase [Mycolicibacterium palauense]